MGEREVHVEFVFERTGDAAVAQAYRILVPERRGRLGHSSEGERRRDVDSTSSLLPMAVGAGLPATADTDEKAHFTVTGQLGAGA
ncbi:MAG: hypothetical protein ACRDYD_05600 [Acidimicrobiales bacterium]